MKIRNIAHLRKIRAFPEVWRTNYITRSRCKFLGRKQDLPSHQITYKLSNTFELLSIDSLVKVNLLTRVEKTSLLKVVEISPVSMMVDHEGNGDRGCSCKASAGYYLKGYADRAFIETLPHYLAALRRKQLPRLPIMGRRFHAAAREVRS
jgi:hypothetical protein